MKIKACPHCEGKSKTKKDILGFYFVECGSCGCRTRGTVTEEEAINVWNRRVTRKGNSL